jgi:hypothetical protein
METAGRISIGLLEARKEQATLGEQAAGCIILVFVFLIPNS